MIQGRSPSAPTGRGPGPPGSVWTHDESTSREGLLTGLPAWRKICLPFSKSVLLTFQEISVRDPSRVGFVDQDRPFG